MIQNVKKDAKISLCRTCHGRGYIDNAGTLTRCPQCEGSGRVWVSADITLDVKPYRTIVTEQSNNRKDAHTVHKICDNCGYGNPIDEHFDKCVISGETKQKQDHCANWIDE